MMKIRKIAVAAGMLATVSCCDLHATTSTARGFYTGLGFGFGWRNYVGKTTVPVAAFAVQAPPLAAAVDVNEKLKKGKPAFQLFCGYDFAWKSFVLGFELQAGYHLGRIKKTFKLIAAAGAVDDAEVTAKASPYIGTLLRIGCNVAGVAMYAVGGVRFVHHNLRMRDTAGNGAVAGAAAFDITEKKWKAHPCAGATLQYEFSQGYFARLDYLHTFRVKVKSVVKCSDDTVTLGFGVKF
ncbi:MAG: hypothetical protein LBR78_03190 [Holosporales bacterium]|jgi:hypothetical protein|nr:hypothetical protein [Holosporales bacterium]